MNLSLKVRCRAGSIHLAISALIALMAMSLIFLVWYPGALARAQGVDYLVLILIGVDVALGPLMTTIIYVPGKWGLKFDLMVIAAMQTAALLYGLEAIHGGRPAYVVFNVDRFDAIAYQDVNADSLSRAPAGMERSFWGPKMVAAVLPTDTDAKADILFSAIGGGADLPQLPEYFVPLETQREQMLKRQRPMEELRKLNELDDAAWESLLKSFERSESELAYLPLAANARDGAVIIDAKSGEILGIRLLQPRFGADKKKDSESPKPYKTKPAQAVG
ncbi:MAG: TfpX/TfpZ family type IV pilin accessory protein [Panacagrimonas sp.]